jgi:hypothetical protein
MSALQGEFAMERLDEDLDYATLFVIREPRVAREPRATEDAP